MADWKPALLPGVELTSLALSQEEGFVASRLDGATGVTALAFVTGLPPERVQAALERLASLDAITAAPDEGPAPEESGATQRALYEQSLRQLTAAERAALATTASEPTLSALCFDPLPPVVRALLENPGFALPQARLVAAHHPTAAGLEALVGRAALATDDGVRRALLRNPQLSVALLRRLYGGRRLLEQFKITTSREVPEQTRRGARELLRARFSTAEADERVELILKTEGRCLAQLTGLPIDGRTAAALCARTYVSTLLVQNIARWSAAPPPLLAHLLKQELVRRSPALRTQLQRHPNAPAPAG